VRVDGGLSEWFNTVVGVMQGCVLSPLLFDILLEVVIALILENNEIGVNISEINIYSIFVSLMTSVWQLETIRTCSS